jgi:hypothetical protein
MKKLIGFIGIAALLAACDSGGGKGSEVELDNNQKATVETSSKALVESGADLGALKTDPGSDETFSGLSSVFGNASSLWSTKMSAKAGSGSYGAAYGALETATFALSEGCYTESGGTVTYDCNEGGYGIQGEVTVSGDNIVIDLSLTSQGYTFIYTGDITVTETLIDGWIAFDYAVDQTGMTFAYDVKVDYQAVELVDGCAVGGALDIDVDVDIDGLEGLPAGAASAYDYPSVLIEFGPACGDVTMF